MATDYTYNNKNPEPHCEYIRTSILGSLMADKNVELVACAYDGANWDVIVTMTNVLIAGDITILDAIVAASLGWTCECGCMMPTMTTAERNAMICQMAGMVIYNTTTSQVEKYNGSAWIASEPVFAKSTGFNKDFGSAAGTVTEGDKPALLAGRAGGQTLNGGTASGEHLILDSTAHGTKGQIKLLSDVLTDYRLASETNVLLGIGVMGAGNIAHGAGEEGWNNIAIGNLALNAITTSAGNIAIGFEASKSLTTAKYTVAIGHRALSNLTTTNIGAVAIGYMAGFSAITADKFCGVGLNAGYSYTANSGTFLGCEAGYYATIGSSCTYVGTSAGMGASGTNEASHCTAVGASALDAIATGGSGSVALGYAAGMNNTSGGANVYIGAYAGLNNQTGASNVIAGYMAANGVASNSNENNVIIGRKAAYDITTSSNNVMIGRSAGEDIITGGNNILIGYKVADNLTTGTGNIIIAHDTDADAVGTANNINIGSVYRGDVSTGRAAIGAATAAADVILDLVSTVEAFCPPRMTTAQRDAIGTPIAGMLIWNTDNTCLEDHNGTGWAAV